MSMASSTLFDGDFFGEEEAVYRGVSMEPCFGRQTTARSEPAKGLAPPLSTLGDWGRFPSADSWFGPAGLPAADSWLAPPAPPADSAPRAPTVLEGPPALPARQLLNSVVEGLCASYATSVLKPAHLKAVDGQEVWKAKLELLVGFEPLVVVLRAQGKSLELARSRGDGVLFQSVLRAATHLVRGTKARRAAVPPPAPDVPALVALARLVPAEAVAALGRQARALSDAELGAQLAPHASQLASWLAGEERAALAAAQLCLRLDNAPEFAEVVRLARSKAARFGPGLVAH